MSQHIGLLKRNEDPNFAFEGDKGTRASSRSIFLRNIAGFSFIFSLKTQFAVCARQLIQKRYRSFFFVVIGITGFFLFLNFI